MALTRKMLKGLGLTDEQIDSIIEAHTETVDGLKDQISELKEEAGSLPEIKKELESAKAELESSKKDSWKVKYDAIKEEFDAYKTDQKKREDHAAKESVYTELLKTAGINEKHIPAILKVSDVDSVELDDEGKISNQDDLEKVIKEEWADFIPVIEHKGADVPNPPANNGGNGTKMTKEDIMNITDRDKRIRAIAEHPELFGKGEKK